MKGTNPIAEQLAELNANAELDLFRGALLIAQSAHPNVELERYHQQMNDWGEELLKSLPEDAGFEQRLRQLNHFLFEQLGFSGDIDDYYNPDNSYLDSVIERRSGIPISLSIMYIELGRRIGLPLEGVSFPGHFLVKLDIGDGAVILDPFHRGASLDENDLSEILSSLFNWNETNPTQHLHSASNAEILSRMLRNLRQIHEEKQEPIKTLAIMDLLLAIEPENADHHRDRALTLIELDCADMARDNLDYYLACRPDADDAAVIRQQRESLDQNNRIIH